MRPVLFKLGPLTVGSWGVVVALGILVGLYFARRAAVKKGIDGDKILNLAFYLLVAGLIGGRLVFILTFFKYYLANPVQIIMVQQGGLSIHGAVLGGIIAAFFFCRHHKLSFLKIADVFAPSLLIGQAIGRWGCFLGGHCEGKITNFFLKVKFPLLEGYRHPVQLYESGLDLLAFASILLFGNRFKKDGTVFGMIVIFYSLIRFVTDFVRDGSMMAFGLSYAQIASLATALVVGFILIRPKFKQLQSS